MANLSPGQLSYWKNRTGRNLTLGQAAYQRAQALHAPKPPAPPKAVVQPAPADPTAPPDATALAPGDYQDSTYFAQVGKNAFDRNQAMANYDQQGADDKTAFQEALRRFQEQLPRQQESAVNNRNSQGLLYSGTLGRDLGDLQTNAIRTQADMQGGFDSRERARAAAKQALQDGGTLDDAAAAAAAVDRAFTNDSAAAADRSLVQESPIPPDNQDAGVDVGTPSPKPPRVRQNTNKTAAYLPKGYANWNQAQRSRYWAQKRKARK